MIIPRKGIGPIIATSLFLIISVIAIIGFQTWFNTYSSQTYSNVESSTTQTNDIQSIIGRTLYFKNGGNNNLTITNIKIDGYNCNFSGTLFSGLNEINIDNCYNDLTTSGVKKVVIYTPNAVYEESVKFNKLDLNFVLSFTDLTGADVSVNYTHANISLSNIIGTQTIELTSSASYYSLIKNGEILDSHSAGFREGDNLSIIMTSSNSYSTATSVTVTAGTDSTSWTITTGEAPSCTGALYYYNNASNNTFSISSDCIENGGSVLVKLWGGGGGSTNYLGGAGGYALSNVKDYLVADTDYILTVGGGGQSAANGGAGGYAGGGAGDSTSANDGGGGGGATSFFYPNGTVIVSAGGGGGAAESNGYVAGLTTTSRSPQGGNGISTQGGIGGGPVFDGGCIGENGAYGIGGDGGIYGGYWSGGGGGGGYYGGGGGRCSDRGAGGGGWNIGDTTATGSNNLPANYDNDTDYMLYGGQFIEGAYTAANGAGGSSYGNGYDGLAIIYVTGVIPKVFSFTNRTTCVNQDTIYYSENVTLDLFLGTVNISLVSDYNVSVIKNGLDLDSTSGLFQEGDNLSIRMTTPDLGNTEALVEFLANGTSYGYWKLITSATPALCAAQEYNFTSYGTELFTVPCGCTKFTVKIWGAGGGGNSVAAGGGGGYASKNITGVFGGDEFNISVGEGGKSPSNGGAGGFGGGGAGGASSASNGAGGGGMTNLFYATNGTIIVSAGGGGGASASTGYPAGLTTTSRSPHGGNGISTQGGIGGGPVFDGGCIGDNGIYGIGGDGGRYGGYGIGGGGGGGYYGGGGGRCSDQGAGGGGWIIGDVTISGSTSNAGNSADADYIQYGATAGKGGSSSSNGYDGLAVIQFS